MGCTTGIFGGRWLIEMSVSWFLIDLQAQDGVFDSFLMMPIDDGAFLFAAVAAGGVADWAIDLFDLTDVGLIRRRSLRRLGPRLRLFKKVRRLLSF